MASASGEPELITDLVQIRKLGEQKLDENMRFRLFAKIRGLPEKRLRVIAAEIESRIDCTRCANCCREAIPTLTQKDADRIAAHLGITPAEFEARYTQPGDDPGERMLRLTATGCVFLADNLCTIYEVRPRNCANYPHLVRSDHSLVSRMLPIVWRASTCPIVHNSLEAFKEATGFRRRMGRSRRRRPWR
jgi:uncharacterized protein